LPSRCSRSSNESQGGSSRPGYTGTPGTLAPVGDWITVKRVRESVSGLRPSTGYGIRAALARHADAGYNRTAVRVRGCSATHAAGYPPSPTLLGRLSPQASPARVGPTPNGTSLRDPPPFADRNPLCLGCGEHCPESRRRLS